MIPKLTRAALAVGLSAVAIGAMAQNAAVVNNRPIPTKLVDDFVATLVSQGRPDTPDLRNRVRDELIARELFFQEAEKRGLARKEDVAQQLENARREILIRALMRDHLAKSPVTDADLKAEYERAIKARGEKEYRARHILVEKEDEALAIIAELKKGKAFEELAKKSKDTGSAQNGGDLDWSSPGTFVKEFSDAMVALKKGELTEKPVKSQYGWHVIRLDDIRDAKPPAFDQVSQQIRQELERRRVQALQTELRKRATIK
ncbi:MAG: peptidylprolyl isomerase [Burkholderiaceae bacterium]|nr:peptidylprolyl isomerase [Burkholderiaceae bacterium]